MADTGWQIPDRGGGNRRIVRASRPALPCHPESAIRYPPSRIASERASAPRRACGARHPISNGVLHTPYGRPHPDRSEPMRPWFLVLGLILVASQATAQERDIKVRKD